MKEDKRNQMIKEYYNQLANNGSCSEPLLVLCLILVLIFVFSCCPCKKITTGENTNHDVKDSVRTEYKYIKETIYVRDTTYITIPAQVSTNHTQGEPSHLENDFCTSDARIEPDGSLYHDLRTKKGAIPVEYDKPVTTITESEKEEHTTTDVTDNHQTVTEYVERDYTWWDKTRFYASYILLGWLLINYSKFFKKLIISIFKKFVS